MASTTRTTRTRPPEQDEYVDPDDLQGASEVEDDDLFDDDDGDDDGAFDTAPAEFLKLDDLAVGGFRRDGTKAGRMVIFYPTTVELECEGDTGPYKALYGDLAVLDGPKIEDRLDAVPSVLPSFKISGAFIVPGVLGLFTVDREVVLGGRDTEHALHAKNPKRFFAAGRLNSKKNKRGTLSWFLEQLTPEEKAKARKFHTARMAALESDDGF